MKFLLTKEKSHLIDFVHRFLMFNSLKDMQKAANWNGKGYISRENLMEKLQSILLLLVLIHQRNPIYFRIFSSGYHATTETIGMFIIPSN